MLDIVDCILISGIVVTVCKSVKDRVSVSDEDLVNKYYATLN